MKQNTQTPKKKKKKKKKKLSFASAKQIIV